MCSYAMLIKRWYFPIFIFVGLGKVAGGFHGIGGEIRRPPGSNDKPANLIPVSRYPGTSDER